MKKTRLFLLLGFCLWALAPSVSAQVNITIRGEVEGGAGKTVGLYRYIDMLTRVEELVDQTTIAENRRFELHGYSNYPTLMFLQIEDYSQSFFVEPGREYEIYIPAFDWDINEKKNIFLDPVALPLEFLGMPQGELNGLISDFESTVAGYIDSHRFYFDSRFRPQRRYFDSLEAEVARRNPDTENNFFNRYKTYKLAELKYSLQFESRRHLANRLVKGQPILYYDENYMSFFTTLFAGAVSKGTSKIPIKQLAGWVNELKLDVLLDSLGTDSLLRNEQVRELAALEGLQEAYYDARYYEGDKVVQMIDLIGARSKFPEHRQLAQRMSAHLREGTSGTDVPSFTLPDIDRQPVSLDSMKGKWVYLSFVRVGDPSCQAEIETLAHFKDSIYAKNDNVEFITIDCDREFQKMYSFLRNSKRGRRCNWTWLHFDGNYKLLEHYQVVSYPHFILINPDGQLQYTVTPAPATGFLLQAPWMQKQEEESKPFFLLH